MYVKFDKSVLSKLHTPNCETGKYPNPSATYRVENAICYRDCGNSWTFTVYDAYYGKMITCRPEWVRFWYETKEDAKNHKPVQVIASMLFHWKVHLWRLVQSHLKFRMRNEKYVKDTIDRNIKSVITSLAVECSVGDYQERANIISKHLLPVKGAMFKELMEMYDTYNLEKDIDEDDSCQMGEIML